MVEELMIWAALLSAKSLATAQNASNLLLLLYVISCILHRKAAFLAAFLCFEFYGMTTLVSNLSNVEYYIGYMLISSVAYWYIYKRYHMVKTALGYGILLLFDGVMAADAYLYPNFETPVSSSYVGIVVAIHLYIIITSIRWNALRKALGEGFKCLCNMFCSSYSLTFFWYNLRKSN